MINHIKHTGLSIAISPFHWRLGAYVEPILGEVVVGVGPIVLKVYFWNGDD